MLKHFKYIFALATLVVLTALSIPVSSKAESVSVPEYAGTAYDLVNAVNALRASNGLPAYSISSILMYTAQAQADFMAATSTVTHTGPGGISVTDRLLAAGYPLAGDLSLGGFRSENIISNRQNMSAQAAVDAWTGDAPHLNTMLSPDLTEIGAGVSGLVYYVIDAARPTTGGAGASALTQSVAGGSAVPAVDAVVRQVVISTPNAAGDVIHVVQSGQSLWQIAIDYGVKIDDIKRLNYLLDNNIYPGEKLVIKKLETLPTVSPTELPTTEIKGSPTNTITFTALPVQPTYTLSSSPIPSGNLTRNNSTVGAVMGIIGVALLGGGLFMILGNKRRE